MHCKVMGKQLIRSQGGSNNIGNIDMSTNNCYRYRSCFQNRYNRVCLSKSSNTWNDINKYLIPHSFIVSWVIGKLLVIGNTLNILHK